MKRWIVVGGGFRGIVGAHFLAKAGCAVTLLERAGYMGGVLHSQEWEGLYLDKGCHLFDNVYDESTTIMHEIMGDEVMPVTVKYASVTEGIKSEGVAVPDYSQRGRAFQERVLLEVVEAAADRKDASNLAELLTARYGPTLGEALGVAAAKMFQADPVGLDASAFSSTPFARIRIVGNEAAMVLKESPALDERIAVPSQDDPMKFYRHRATRYPYRNFYPRGKGLRTFCERSLEHLRQLAVDVRLGESVEAIWEEGPQMNLATSSGGRLEADRVLWTMDTGSLCRLLFEDDPLEDLRHDVPMAVHYYRCPREDVGDYTYIHDFSEDSLVFRGSAPGMYGDQTDEKGATYVALEIPTAIGSPVWEDPDSYRDSVWQEAKALGIVNGKTWSAHTVLRAPVTYRLGKVGFSAAKNEGTERVGIFSKRIVLSDSTAFSKAGIVSDLRDIASR